MKEILNFLNENSGAFSLLFSFLVTCAAIIYAILTWKLVSETRKLRKAQTEPNVCTYIQTMPGWLLTSGLVIQNIGLGPAHNIKFEFKPDFKISDKQNFSELNFIKYGIDFLAPNQKVYPFTFLRRDKEQLKEPLEMKITYENSLGKEETNTFVIVLEEIVGVSELESTWIGKISHELREIKDSLHSISSAIEKLRK